jgi:hypothetical protein
MAVQYPHKIQLTTVSGSVQDGQGNWTAGTESTVEKSCRAEPNSSSGLIATADGSKVNYSWTVYLPLPVDPIAPGTVVKILSGARVLCNDKVIRFSEGQLNARVWL